MNKDDDKKYEDAVNLMASKLTGHGSFPRATLVFPTIEEARDFVFGKEGKERRCRHGCRTQAKP